VKSKERKHRIPPIVVTADEKRKFEKFAESQHLPLSTLVRQLLHREADASSK